MHAHEKCRKTQRKDKDRTDSILACVAFFQHFSCACVAYDTLETGLEHWFDHANIGTSALDPESVVHANIGTSALDPESVVLACVAYDTLETGLEHRFDHANIGTSALDPESVIL